MSGINRYLEATKELKNYVFRLNLDSRISSFIKKKKGLYEIFQLYYSSYGGHLATTKDFLELQDVGDFATNEYANASKGFWIGMEKKLFQYNSIVYKFVYLY